MASTGSAFSRAVIVTPENRDAQLRGAPLFFRLVCGLVARIKFGALTFVLPDGRALRFEGDREKTSEGVIIVKDFEFARRSVLSGDIGFFESFADEQWDTPSLADCLYIFARNADYVREAFRAVPFVDWLDNLRQKFNRNTREGARRNISSHYDLGNEFYEKWLDRTMTYSSALYPAPEADLGTAQTNKYRALAESIHLRPGDDVLEIGSGWGGFAEYAAQIVGANVTGVTISKAQYDYSCERIFRAGLADKVRFRLQDYRDVEGTFDKIASIEMFEAVGREYWSAYFAKVRDVLKPGGVAGLQVITIADRFFKAYQKSTDFIQRHIFPGGALPSPSTLKALINDAGLVWNQAISFGEHYARTLHEWHARFVDARDEIQRMGFDERFQKLWRYYLSYCEAGFRARTIDVSQIAAVRQP